MNIQYRYANDPKLYINEASLESFVPDLPGEGHDKKLHYFSGTYESIAFLDSSANFLDSSGNPILKR